MTDEPVMNDYCDLLLDAYRGEVLGAALFGAMADAAPDDRQREQLRALQRVEARTAARLRTLVDAAGLDPGADAAAADGARMAEGTGGQDWPAFLSGLRRALPPFLANFERLRELGTPDDAVLTDLVAHERAIDRFAALEIEGRHDDALAVLDAHLATV
ncbi:MAG TPA: hypothetical protein VH986_13225 [Acidimicrobiia bacterium]|jgi:hypothetical protein